MEKEKISNGEIGALGIDDLDLLVAFSRVANGLLKHQVMDKASILTNLEALIADPTPTRDTACLLAGCWQPLPTPLYHMQLASTSLAECA
ncbi:hypothetical protein [Dyadobacter fermentans]|uniref:hypothetical protein n=1 Tax=Dyadobacter fermentans TaxID=94254 RepID=UPI001CC0DE47|nr:hypothetical protein [Dyadobacter fermentans]